MGSGNSKKQKRMQTPPRRVTTPPAAAPVADSICSKEIESAPVSVIPTAQMTMSTEMQGARWQRGTLIGKGAHGQVFECLNLDTGEIHVMKEVHLTGSIQQIQTEVAALKREIMTLKTLKHKNIVRYIHTQVSDDKKHVEIIMEYVSGGSLKAVLEKYGKLEEGIASRYMKQVLEGVVYLHENGIMHRDLKCANILVDQTGTIKLTDFGAAKHVTQPGSDFSESKSLTGSPYWMAPEVVKRSGHSFPSDIWSIGCVLIEMVTGSPPWSDRSRQAIAILRLLAETTQPPAFPPSMSPKGRSFLDLCLRIDPSRRATAAELLKHAFITGTEGPGASIDKFHPKPQANESYQSKPQATDSLQSWSLESLEVAEPYGEVFNVYDIPMTGQVSKPGQKPPPKPQQVQTRQGVSPAKHQVAATAKPDNIQSRGRKAEVDAPPRKAGKLFAQPEESVYEYDPKLQAMLDEKARRIEEERRRDTEAARRAHWQAELDFASRINYVDN